MNPFKTILPSRFERRLRALHDRRGELIREGTSYRAGRVHDWRIVRSVRGRINQVDLLIDGQLWRTGSLERAEIAVASGVWRSWGKGVNTKSEKPAQICAA